MKQLIDLNGKWDLYLAPHNQVKELVKWNFMNPDAMCKQFDTPMDFLNKTQIGHFEGF